MWDVLNIKHPQYHTNKVDIFSQIGIFKLGEIQSYVKNLRKSGDKHMIEALERSGIYLHEYLHITLLGNTLKIISATSYGTEVLTCVFEFIYMVSFEHMEQVKSDIESIKLVEFPG